MKVNNFISVSYNTSQRFFKKKKKKKRYLKMEDLKEKISPLLKPRDLFSTLVGAHPILAPDTDSSPKQSTTTDSKNDYVPNSNVTHNTCGNVTNTAGNLENGSTNLQFGYANNINIK